MKLIIILILALASRTLASIPLTVAADGSGGFRTVQEAVDAAPAASLQPVVIHLKPGVYKGHVMVPANKPFLTFEGDDPETTIITDDKNVHALDASGNKLTTKASSTLLIEAEYFSARNLTIENTAGNHGQALALFANADRASFVNCRFLGWQDTVRVESARQYFRDCKIQGNCDYIYGNATAVFERCHLHCLENGFITAASTPDDHRFGFVFLNCRVTTDAASKRTFLGRPWRPHASVTFINTELSAGILPAGWDNWRDPSKEKTARFSEFNSTGPGANPSKRVAWSRQLDKSEAEAITLEAVFGMPDLSSLRKDGRWPADGKSDTRLRIVLAGDSTVTDKAGWGAGFADCLNGDAAICINLAKGGRSSKSFRDEGQWRTVLASKPDYILIQFGHNDMSGKGPERETDPPTTYHENMRRFVVDARAAGAKPILVTSMTRRHFKDGKINSDLFPYVDEVKKLAAEMNAPVIDLHAKSIGLFEKIGLEGCTALSPVDPKTGGVDGTHLNAKGGEVIGKLVAGEFSKIEPSLIEKDASTALPASSPASASIDEMRLRWNREPSNHADDLHFRKAEKNGRLAAEAFFRSRKYIDGWLAHADPKSGLIPRNLKEPFWNGRDAAADNYSFMVLTASMTDQPLLTGRLTDMLRSEARLTRRTDNLPDDFLFSTQSWRRPAIDRDAMIFDGAEYAKDGLLFITEWMGRSEWTERMIGIIDDIWKDPAIDTPFGKIPTLNFEVNGDLLQVCSRLYWFTGERKYLDWAARLGDYFLLGRNHPTRDSASLTLGDHSCEVINGLSELYLTVSKAWPAKREAYRKPIHELYDRILKVGVNEHGMMFRSVNPQTGAVIDKNLTDNWGYNYDGFYTVWLVDGTPAYHDAVLKILSNLKAHYTGQIWERGSADGYADSVEGAITLLNREPVESGFEWVDSEIRTMWAKQRPDGVIEGWHGDGNFARTSLMYALLKTQGCRIEPWRSDVRVGAVRDGDRLYLSLTAEQAWSGKLVFDRPRHKTLMHLPLDYPRINQFPEWFTLPASIHPEGVPVAISPGQELRMSFDVRGNQVRSATAAPTP